jgi:hypothetical protein
MPNRNWLLTYFWTSVAIGILLLVSVLTHMLRAPVAFLIFMAFAAIQSVLYFRVRCPNCGKSVYRRDGLEPGGVGGELTRTAGWWPEARCSRCGADLP